MSSLPALPSHPFWSPGPCDSKTLRQDFLYTRATSYVFSRFYPPPLDHRIGFIHIGMVRPPLRREFYLNKDFRVCLAERDLVRSHPLVIPVLALPKPDGSFTISPSHHNVRKPVRQRNTHL